MVDDNVVFLCGSAMKGNATNGVHYDRWLDMVFSKMQLKAVMVVFGAS